MEHPPSILLCGVMSEPPLQLVAQALDRRNTPYLELNQRQFEQYHIAFTVADGLAIGELTIGDERHLLEGIGSVYTRLTDWETLPEVARAEPDDPITGQCRQFHDTLQSWIDLMPGLVLNPTHAMASNMSKPYQAQMIRKYFRTPDTIITNDPGAALRFLTARPRAIYKSTSGARSIVVEVIEDDLDRLEELAHCPTMFQAHVDGTDVRVHTVGSRTFATGVDSSSTDYRYGDGGCGSEAQLYAVDLSPEVEAACVQLARDLELPFAGIDLRITNAGEVYCFEVNPSPAYSYYQQAAGQPIADGLADLLESPHLVGW